MDKKYWKDLYHSLQIEEPADAPKADKPTLATIRAYEERTGFRFPNDYVEYIQVFGPGVLGREFRILAPGYESCLPEESNYIDLYRNHSFSSQPITEEWLIKILGIENINKMQRMHHFSSTFEGESISWDPNDPTEWDPYEPQDPTAHDYKVFIWLRDRSNPELIANSFVDFVNDVCLGNAYAQFFRPYRKWNEAERGSQRVFWPMIDSRK